MGRAADCRLPREGILSYPNGEALLEEALRLGADVVGAIPHFEFTREYGVESLHIAFRLAKSISGLWISTAMKLMMNSRGSLKPWRPRR